MPSHLLAVVASATLFAASAVSASQPDTGLSLEPCINGAVSASGTHVSQSREDIVRYFADGVVYSDDPNYLYMVEGHILAPAHLVQR